MDRFRADHDASRFLEQLKWEQNVTVNKIRKDVINEVLAESEAHTDCRPWPSMRLWVVMQRDIYKET